MPNCRNFVGSAVLAEIFGLLTAKTKHRQAWPCCFYSKTGFWPSYCQISTDQIKFCTHLLLYGIHFWADLDRDRRVGGSKPNQNDFFCKRTLSPIQRRRIAAISAANRQSGSEDWCYREKFRNFVAWAEPDPKTTFSRFRVPFDCPAHSLQETVLPKSNGTDGKPRLWRCAFASLESLWPGIWQI